MAVIECNEINQTINELLIAFQTCKEVKPSDLNLLVELVAAVSTCSNGGPNYDTLNSITYDTMGIVTFPVNSFHSFSLNVLEGNIIYEGNVFPAGSTRNVEFTTLNQTAVSFNVLAGGKVFFQYLTETI